MKPKNVFKRKTAVLLVSVFCVALITIPFLFAADQYEYDNLGRVKKVTHDDGTQVEYSYDKTGNRITAGEKVISSNHVPNIPTNPSPPNQRKPMGSGLHSTHTVIKNN